MAPSEVGLEKALAPRGRLPLASPFGPKASAPSPIPAGEVPGGAGPWCGDGRGAAACPLLVTAECFQGHFCLIFPLLKLQPWLLLGPLLLLPPRPQLWGRAQSTAPAAVPLCPVLLPHHDTAGPCDAPRCLLQLLGATGSGEGPDRGHRSRVGSGPGGCV